MRISLSIRIQTNVSYKFEVSPILNIKQIWNRPQSRQHPNRGSICFAPWFFKPTYNSTIGRRWTCRKNTSSTTRPLVMITGASAGIGAEIARIFQKRAIRFCCWPVATANSMNWDCPTRSVAVQTCVTGKLCCVL